MDIYSILKKGNKYLNRIFKTKRRLLLSVILLVSFLILINKFKPIFFTSILILAGILSFAHNRYFRYSHYIGFELCILATVLTSLAYGPAVGAFTGFVSITGGMILGSYFKHSSFISILTLPLIGLIVPFFSDLSLPFLGLIMTLIYDAIILPLYVIMGSRISSAVIFFITHVMLNFWIFSTVAPLVYGLMV